MSKILDEKIISISDLLPDDYQQCVKDALRDAIIGWFHNLNTDDKSRVISNMSYRMIYDIIKYEMPDVSDKIKESVIDKIENKTNYGFYVFGYDGLYNNPKAGQKIIDQAIRENADKIRIKTEESIAELSKKDIKQFMVNFQYKMK